MKPSLFRIMVKDALDFSIVLILTFALTLAIYFLSPSFVAVDLSFYFFEQFIELFFVNPGLVIWFLGLGFSVSIIYYLFSAMLLETTFGGHLTGMLVVHRASGERLTLMESVLMAIGAYAGVLCFFLGPIFAFWLDTEHRGWSEKIARVMFVKRGVSSTVR